MSAPSAIDDCEEDVDVILPLPTYTALQLRNEIGAIHGGTLQLKVWLDRALRADQDARLAADVRLGGVDRRLDQLEARMSGIEQNLERLVELLTPRRGSEISPSDP